MRTEQLVRMLTSLGAAADVVEAIDDPALQARRGWDLKGWTYDCVPWGVRFLRHDGGQEVTGAVVAVALTREGLAFPPPAYARAPWPTRLLLLG